MDAGNEFQSIWEKAIGFTNPELTEHALCCWVSNLSQSSDWLSSTDAIQWGVPSLAKCTPLLRSGLDCLCTLGCLSGLQQFVFIDPNAEHPSIEVTCIVSGPFQSDRVSFFAQMQRFFPDDWSDDRRLPVSRRTRLHVVRNNFLAKERFEAATNRELVQAFFEPFKSRDVAFFKSFMTGPTILRVKRGDRIILEEPELVRILEMNQRVSSTPLSPPKGIFTPPKGTFTLLEFAMALTEVNSSESEQKEEAKRLKKDLQRHWQDDSSRKPRVRATGSRDVEYFDFDDLVQIAKERGVYFDAESVKKRLSG